MSPSPQTKSLVKFDPCGDGDSPHGGPASVARMSGATPWTSLAAAPAYRSAHADCQLSGMITVPANLDELYTILRGWALDGRPQTYRQLSEAYRERTGDWLHWRGSWDEPLGDINNRLAGVGAPALSAVVILHDQNEPGGQFWGCAPNVPPRPRTDQARLTEWTRILNEVRAYPWPPTLGDLVGERRQ